MKSAGTLFFSVKAGRCTYVEGLVTPLVAPGKLRFEKLRSDDHHAVLRWVEQETNSILEEFIIFPGDLELKVLEREDGVVLRLKFSANNTNIFYWVQEKVDLDEEALKKTFSELSQY